MSTSDYILFDTAPAVYSAMYSKGLNELKYKNTPIGGIVNILRGVISSAVFHTKAYLAFDSRSFRKDIEGAYKKGRESRPDVYVQLDLLQRILKESNIPFGIQEGYEADDVIYTVCTLLKRTNNFSKIRIRSNDYDLLHNIDLQGRIVFEGITDNVRWIDSNNISTLYDGDLPINMKTPRNVFLGDGDYNKVYKMENGLTGRVLYNKFKSIVLNKNSIDLNKVNSKELIRTFISLCKPTEKDLEELEKRMEIFFPKITKDIDVGFITYETLLSRNFANIIEALNCEQLTKTYKLFLSKTVGNENRLNLGKPNRITRILDEVNKDYENGVYMVDHNLKLDLVGKSSDFLDNF